MANVKATVVGVDTYRWVDEDGAVQSAERGQLVEVSEKEFARIDGALEKAGNSGASSSGGGKKAATEKPIEKLSNKEIDKRALELNVEGWDLKADLAKKRTALSAWVEEHPPVAEPSPADTADTPSA